MTTALKSAALAACVAMLSGCASIVSGSTDEVRIDSKPTGATCDVYRSGEILNRIVTPQTITVKRRGNTLLTTCEKDGLAGSEKLKSSTNMWVLGNFGFAVLPVITIVGLAVDGVTGAWHGYDDATVELKAN